MRLMFLEFDGVLHPRGEGHIAGDRLRWLPILEALLARAPDVRVIVHSSWRYEYTDEELRSFLGPLSARFAGTAPRVPRELAIETVLQSKRKEVHAHLVLDDDPSEFSSGRLKALFCHPNNGLSDTLTQAAIATWLCRTAPVVHDAQGFPVPRGLDELVLYLDFDGVLHHENVLWDHKRGAHAGAPGFPLFEHAPLLAELLAPYPQLHIVLSTSWVRKYGCYDSAKRLPLTLRERVIGATFHSAMNEDAFVRKPRGQQVVEDVMRRRPRSWLAIDDTDEGWPVELRDHVFITDERLGLSAPGIAEQLARKLELLTTLQG